MRCNLNKEEYVKLVNEKIDSNARNLLLKQIERYYDAANNYKPKTSNYKTGDLVKLKKGTFLRFFPALPCARGNS